MDSFKIWLQESSTNTLKPPARWTNGSYRKLSLKHCWKQKHQNSSCPTSGTLWNMRRQVRLEKTVMLGKIEDGRKRRRTNMRWIYSIKDAMGMSLQELGRAVENRTLRISVTDKNYQEFEPTQLYLIHNI